MSRIDPRRIACPLCGSSFDGWLVLASRSRGPLTTDLRRYDEGEDPIPLQVNGCPTCGLVGEVIDFEEMAPSPDQPVPGALTGAFWDQGAWEEARGDGGLAPPDSTLGEQLEAWLAPRAAEAHEDPRLRYEHHAQVVRWLGRGPLREGDAWLRAAWLHADAGDTDAELRCRRRALHCYRAGTGEPRWLRRKEDRMVVGYLVAELVRRLDGDEAARPWYEQAIAWSSGLPQMQELVQLAERQMLDPREVV